MITFGKSLQLVIKQLGKDIIISKRFINALSDMHAFDTTPRIQDIVSVCSESGYFTDLNQILHSRHFFSRKNTIFDKTEKCINKYTPIIQKRLTKQSDVLVKQVIKLIAQNVIDDYETHIATRDSQIKTANNNHEYVWINVIVITILILMLIFFGLSYLNNQPPIQQSYIDGIWCDNSDSITSERLQTEIELSFEDICLGNKMSDLVSRDPRTINYYLSDTTTFKRIKKFDFTRVWENHGIHVKAESFDDIIYLIGVSFNNYRFEREDALKLYAKKYGTPSFGSLLNFSRLDESHLLLGETLNWNFKDKYILVPKYSYSFYEDNTVIYVLKNVLDKADRYITSCEEEKERIRKREQREAEIKDSIEEARRRYLLEQAQIEKEKKQLQSI